MEIIDIVSNNKPFLHKSEKTFKTKLGGILTVIYISIAVILCYVYFANLLYYENFQKLNKIEANPIDWDPVDIKVLVKSPKSDEKIQYLYYQINEADKIIMNRTCTEEELKLMNETADDPNFNYYCTVINSFYRWSFKKRCYWEQAKSLGLACESKDRALHYKFLAYEYYSETDMYPKQKSYELKDFHRNVSIFNFNHNKLIIDKDYIFRNLEIIYFSDISYVDFFKSFWTDDGESVMTSLVEVYSRTNFVIEKNYHKFGDQLAKVSSVLCVIILLIYFFYDFYLNYCFEKDRLEFLLKYIDINYFLPQKNELNLEIFSSIFI